MFYIDLQYEKTIESSGKVTDRFDLAKFLDYANSFHEPLSSHLLRELNKLPVHGTYRVVSEDNRPELLAYKIYGQVQLWWVVMHYNSIVSVQDIKNSQILKYPSLGDLEKLYYSLPGLAA